MIEIEIEVCGSNIREIRRSARAEFKKLFGSKKSEQRAFNLALETMEEVYENNPEQLRRRIGEVLIEGYEKARDLTRYFSALVIAEGKSELSLEEIIKIIRVVPLRVGKPLYHFSNKQHEIGYEGHKGMCFTKSRDFRDVVANINLEDKIYCHTCLIKRPEWLFDHDAQTLYENKVPPSEIINIFLLDTERRRSDRWFEAKRKGAIVVYSVEELKSSNWYSIEKLKR